MPIVRVALDVPLHTLFDYAVAEEAAVGQCVTVPFCVEAFSKIIVGLEGAMQGKVDPGWTAQRHCPIRSAVKQKQRGSLA